MAYRIYHSFNAMYKILGQVISSEDGISAGLPGKDLTYHRLNHNVSCQWIFLC